MRLSKSKLDGKSCTRRMSTGKFKASQTRINIGETTTAEKVICHIRVNLF